jgi:hypothetical protein
MRAKILAGLMLCVAAAWGAPQANASKLYISEYNSLASASAAFAQAAGEPAITDQTPVDFSGGAAQSAVFNVATQFVRVICDVQCSIKFGTNPTAANTNKVLPALTPEYFGVTPGGTLKISVISNP